jgi:hypothetical protein
VRSAQRRLAVRTPPATYEDVIRELRPDGVPVLRFVERIKAKGHRIVPGQ